MAELPDNHVVVKFGKGIPGLMQGEVLLQLEKWMRERGCKAEIFKDPMGDDSKLRVLMSPTQRAKL